MCMQIQSTVNCDIESKDATKFSENLLINLKVMQKRFPINEKSFDSKSFIHLKVLYEYGITIFVFIRKYKPIFPLVILTNSNSSP